MKSYCFFGTEGVEGVRTFRCREVISLDMVLATMSGG